MLQEQTELHLPLKSILLGGLAAFVMVLLLATVITIMTSFGWTGIIRWASTLYLIAGYLAIVVGAIYAGYHSKVEGWITGIGVGLVSTILFLFIALFSGTPVTWMAFLIKMLINSFIGSFGGIIGVNLSET